MAQNKTRPEYDGYLMVEDENIRESFRVLVENFRDLEKQFNDLQTTVGLTEDRVTTLENA
jgi:hypothetical protein|tara:strand:+ start:647 stop:826 length:180 start_codon:yes stop_codon:yes gene_type:complete